MAFTLASQMYHRKSVLVPVLVRVPEYLSPSTSTSTSTMTLELTSTSTVQVPEIQYSSTASTSTEYEYPSPAKQTLSKLPLSDATHRSPLKLVKNMWVETMPKNKSVINVRPVSAGIYDLLKSLGWGLLKLR